jgi:CRISPR type III-A-associated protein Csm2
MENIWCDAQSNIAKVLTPQTFDTWIRPITFLSLKANQLFLEVPNKFVKEWVEEKYLSMIQEAISSLTGIRFQIEFKVNEKNPAEKVPDAAVAAIPFDEPPPRENRSRDDRRSGPGGERRFEGPPEIDLEKLIADSLYLDNQAHAVVSRLRDMDSGTKSQLRRFYNAVRRACRTPENERQHEFVMLRARLAYTIARHSLRSMDVLEKLLLQVTRKNTAPGYERFRDLFEAIVAYNE